MTFPGPRTTLAGVVGHPIGHSLSPAIHNAALRHDEIDALYMAFDVPPDALREALTGLGALGAAGCNITVPHKQDALAIADEASEGARRAGAANTIVFSGGRMIAHNTDPDGIRGVLGELGQSVGGVPALVLGAGGAARGAAWWLAGQGAVPVRISNRTGGRAERLVQELREAGFDAGSIEWEHRGAAAGASGIIVNATTVGMGDDASALDAEALRAAAYGGCRLVLDLVYAPGGTALVRAARDTGLVAEDGLGVLVHQAAAAYELMWGRPAPIAVMAEAVGRRPGGDERPEEMPPLV